MEKSWNGEKERYVKEQEESCLVCVTEININSENNFQRVKYKYSMIPKMLTQGGLDPHEDHPD